MNKYQRALNKTARYNMQEPINIELMYLFSINNSFRTNRRIFKIVTKGYSFDQLVRLKNLHLQRLKGNKQEG